MLGCKDVPAPGIPASGQWPPLTVFFRDQDLWFCLGWRGGWGEDGIEEFQETPSDSRGCSRRGKSQASNTACGSWGKPRKTQHGKAKPTIPHHLPAQPRLAQDSTGSTFLCFSVGLSVTPGPGARAAGGPVKGTLGRGGWGSELWGRGLPALPSAQSQQDAETWVFVPEKLPT